VSRLESLLRLVNRAQLIGRFESSIGIRRSRPRNALRAGDVPAAQRSLLRIIGHVRPCACVLIRRANIYKRLSTLSMIAHFVEERANLLIRPLRRLVFRFIEIGNRSVAPPPFLLTFDPS